MVVGVECVYGIFGYCLNFIYLIEKVMWVWDNEFDVWVWVCWVCVVKDFIVLWLIGWFVMDCLDVFGINVYDQVVGIWLLEIFVVVWFDFVFFFEIFELMQIVGVFMFVVVEVFGFYIGVQVVMGGGDGLFVVVGFGIVVFEDGVYVCFGIFLWIFFVVDVLLYDFVMWIFMFDNVVLVLFVLIVIMQVGGVLVQWIVEVFLFDFVYLEIGCFVVEVVSDVDIDDFYFFFYLFGECVLLWDFDVCGVFVGFVCYYGWQYFVCVVLEGMVFNFFMCIQVFCEVGVMIDCIDVVGGGVQSDVYFVVFVDVWGVLVCCCMIVEEVNSFGVVVIGVVGFGFIDFFVVWVFSEVMVEFVFDFVCYVVYVE